MSDLIPPYISASNENSAIKESRSRFKALVPAFLSSFIPGSGQFILKENLYGGLLLSTFIVLLLCFWPLRLLRSYSGFLSIYSAWLVLFLSATCNAVRSSKSCLSRWWLLATVPWTLITISFLGIAVTRMAGFRSFLIPSTSMEKTIQRGDRLMVDTTYYHSHPIKRQDIVVFKKDATFFIKRVVALGGDVINEKNQDVYVNGQLQNEPFVEHIGNAPDWQNNFDSISVPANKYFVMGDNRDVSLDSRSSEFGLVDTGAIIGKPLYIYGSDRQGQRIK